MKWFKHQHTFRHEPLVARLRAEFGTPGYAAICLILEVITGEWKKGGRPEPALPLKEWESLTGFSPKKFQKFLEICGNNSSIRAEVDQKLLRIEVPILLELKDEYASKPSEKSRQTPDSSGTMSATDKQKEQDKEKRQNNNRSPTETEVRELRKLLRERGIDPDSARGEHLYDLAISNAKKSFTGYIVGLLKNDPDYGRKLDAIPRGERQNRPVAIGEILLQSPLLAGQRERLALTNNNSAIIDTKKES